MASPKKKTETAPVAEAPEPHMIDLVLQSLDDAKGLVDAGDVIVHIFRPEVREFYNIEKMWAADFAADGR